MFLRLTENAGSKATYTTTFTLQNRLGRYSGLVRVLLFVRPNQALVTGLLGQPDDRLHVPVARADTHFK
jgi:hypothetical protein